jgi:acylphosphatase
MELDEILVSGRVQGVGFRHSARTMARYFGLKGFVKNLNDGRVYIEAEGSREKLDEFLAWCRKGPGVGHVDSVEKKTGKVKGYSGFVIRL